MIVHPTRTRARRSTEPPPYLVVIHTSEQAFATVDSAERLASAIASPATATNTASYHYGVDLDSVVDLVPELDIAYHCGRENWRGISVCLTGRAGRDWTGTTDGVDDTPELERAAELVASICRRRSIPVRRPTLAELKAGAGGICGHVDITYSFGGTNHTDPGESFPWSTFLAMVDRYVNGVTPTMPPTEPVPELDETELLGELVALATPAKLIRFDGYPSVFLIGAGPALHLTTRSTESYVADGYEIEVLDAHPLGVLSVLHQAGISLAQFKDPGSVTL